MSIGPGMACVPCKTYFRPRTNGVYVLETLDDGVTPYKVWQADLFECPECGTQLIAGYGMNALSVKHEDNFPHFLNMVTHTIEGCPRTLP